MLFDLKGRRRRVVQATYLTLAVLMGGGLVLFGIGGDVSGGLFDAFSERGGGGGGSLVEDRVERAEKRLQQNPRDEVALKELVRARYQLASDNADPSTGEFDDEGKQELARAAQAWERYLALDPAKPDDSLAALMIQAYGELALNRPDRAAEAAEIVSEARPSSQAFIQLVRYASLAGQTRKADLAGEKAIDLASKQERSTVRQAVKQAKTPAPAPQG